MADALKILDKQTLDVIKYAPVKSPISEYGSDNESNYNNLRGKIFQFAYNYIYQNSEESVLSPASQIAIPQNEELINGDYVENNHVNNYIAIKCKLGHFTAEKIQLYIREGNNGKWFYYEKYIKPTSSIVTSGTKIYENGHYWLMSVGAYGGVDTSELKEGMYLKNEWVDAYIVYVDYENNQILLSQEPTATGIPNINVDEEYYYFIFRNNKLKIGIDQDKINLPYHNVPLKAGSQSIIEGNRLVYGNILEGYDNVDIDVLLEFDYDTIPDYRKIEDLIDEPEEFYCNDCQLASGKNRALLIVLKDEIIVNEYYEITLIYTDSSFDKINYLIKEGDDEDSISLSIADQIESTNKFDTVRNGSEILSIIVNYNPATYYYNTVIVRYNNNLYVTKDSYVYAGQYPSGTSSDNTWWIYLTSNDEYNRIIQATQNATPYLNINDVSAYIYTSKTKYKSFKYNSENQIAIEYLDEAGRSGNANTNNKCVKFLEVNIPELFLFNNDFFKINLLLNVKHQPPDWAYYYRILYYYPKIWFEQFMIYGFGHSTPDIYLHADGKYHIKINRAIRYFNELYKKSILSEYIFEKGDRIKIIGNISGTLRYNRFENLQDLEIIGWDYPTGNDSYEQDEATGDDQEYIRDDKGNKIRDTSKYEIIIENLNIDSLISDSEYLIYEIYRPNKELESKVFYTIGQDFEIGNPTKWNRYHKGSIQDQAYYDPSNTPAKIKIDNGACYIKIKLVEPGIVFPAESMLLSDFYESNSIDIGKSNIESESGQFDKFQSIKWGNKYLEGTKTNGICEFEFIDNEKVFESKNGSVNGLKQSGWVLRVVQDKEITSLYIGRESIINPDGTETLQIIKGSVFGTVRPYLQSYGSKYANSLVTKDSYLYFFDSIRGKYCRAAFNGIFPISDYGMSNEFMELSKEFERSAIKKITSVYDYEYDELLTSFQYYENIDYDISIGGYCVNGSNILTKVYTDAGTDLDDLKDGFIMFPSISGIVPDNTYILKFDKYNRTITLNNNVTPGSETPVLRGFTVTKRLIRKTHSFVDSIEGMGNINKWKEKLSFVPEMYGQLGKHLFSFEKGQAWYQYKLKSGDDYVFNKFYDVEYPLEITFSSNGDNLNKLYDGIEIMSNEKLFAKYKGDIYILANTDGEQKILESKLPSDKFKKISGKFVSEFLRDMNSPEFTNENLALINGRYLRGQAAIIKLTNETINEFVLHSIKLYITPSKIL
jgi:hypothetical protein